jgi:hypothetical protein
MAPIQVVNLIYPFVFAIYPILHLYTSNPGEATPHHLVWPITLSLGLTFVFWSGAWVAMRDSRKASLSASSGIIVFFAYGYVFPTVQRFALPLLGSPTPQTHFANHERTLQWVVAIIAVGAVCLAVRRIARLGDDGLNGGSAALSVAAGVLVAFVAVPTLFDVRPRSSGTRTDALVTATIRPRADLPDFYHIVLDGYGRRDVLARHFDLDNGSFLEALEREGFAVATQSRANYYWTFLSLASMLNMRHVTDLREQLGQDASDPTVPFRMLRDSDVARFLKGQGYTTVHLASTWAGTMENSYADVQIPCAPGWFQNNFYRAVAESSFVRVFQSRVTNDIATCHLLQMEALAQTATRPSPKFVFAHFVPPHHPYVFDRHGNVLVSATIADAPVANKLLWARRDLYRDQLSYMNTRVLQVVRTIIARGRRPAVIVVHSDHGPQLVDASGTSLPEDHWARFSNLIAIRAPDSPASVPDDMELVNVYRLLLNKYFSVDLPMVSGAQYYSSSDRPYAFQRVSAETLRHPKQSHD